MVGDRKRVLQSLPLRGCLKSIVFVMLNGAFALSVPVRLGLVGRASAKEKRRVAECSPWFPKAKISTPTINLDSSLRDALRTLHFIPHPAGTKANRMTNYTYPGLFKHPLNVGNEAIANHLPILHS